MMAMINNWFGSIPDSWTVVSFNQSVKRMATGLNPRDNFVLSKTDEYYYVTIRNFKDNQLFLDENCDRISKPAWEIIQARSDLHKGDILFASISKDGQAYLLESEPDNWNINESVFCIRVDEKLFNNRYFRYEITNIGFYNDLLLDATGTTFKSIKQNKLRQSKLIVPPLTEQQAIADYLDNRCSKIDEIIAEATANIEEYKELKQAVIFEAVTKGLDKNVSMKDSGVYCLGMIPSSWESVKTKYLVRVENGSDPVSDGDVPVYGSGANSFKTCGEYKVGPTVLLGRKGATLHIPHYITGLYWNVDTAFNTVPVSESINLKYFYYAAICFDYKAYISQTTLPGMTQTSYRNMKIALPDLNVQNEIVDYLDSKVTEIDALISEKQTLTDDLQAYKKSLIYEVVTGKRRVV